MFGGIKGIGDWVRGLFFKDDEDDRQQQQQPQGPVTRYQSFDAGKLTSMPGNSNSQTTVTSQKVNINVPGTQGVYTPPKNSQSFSAHQKSVIDSGLDKGQSWEDISRDSGVDLESVRSYSEATRPGYGIRQEPKQQTGLIWGVDQAKVDEYKKARDELTTAIKDTRGNWDKQNELLKRPPQLGFAPIQGGVSVDDLRKAKDEVLAVQSRQRLADQALADSVADQPFLTKFGNTSPRQQLESFNAMTGLEQRSYINELRKEVAELYNDFGHDDLAQRRDQASLILNILEDRGQRKQDFDTITEDIADVGRNIVTGAATTLKNVARAGGELAGVRTFAELDEKYKNGEISAETYVRETNKLNNELNQLTGGMQDKGLWDRILRSAGTAIDTTSMIAPVLSGARAFTAARTATAAEGAAARTLPQTTARETAANAALSAGGAFRQGADTTAEDVINEALVGGAFGGVMTGAGAALGAGYTQAKNALSDLSQSMRTRALMTAAEGAEARLLPVDSLTSIEGAPDRARVEEYKSRIASGGNIEPLIVMPNEKGVLTVEDGKHRLQAMRELGVRDANAVLVTPDSLRSVLEGGYARLPGANKEANAVNAPDNRTVTETTEDGTPKTVITQQMGDGSQMVTKETRDAAGNTLVAETERVVPQQEPSMIGRSDAAEGYYDPSKGPDIDRAANETIARNEQPVTSISSVVDDYANYLMIQRPTLAVNKTLARDVAQKELERGRGAGAWQEMFDQLRESGAAIPRRNSKGVVLADSKSGQQLIMKADENGEVRTYVMSGPITKRFTTGEHGEIVDAYGRKKAWEITTKTHEDSGDVEVIGIKIGDETISGSELGDLKNLRNYGSTMATMDENLKAAAPNEDTYKKLSDLTYRHAQKQATDLLLRKAELIEGMKALRKDLGLNMVKKGKKISAAIQEYGEGAITEKDLIKAFGPETAGKIIAADKWFRQQYDALIRQANQVLERYGLDPIPYRKNYYTHFRDPSVFERFGLRIQEAFNSASGIMDETQAKGVRGSIPNELAGFSEYKTPKKQFNPYSLRREGELHTPDAFTAFEKYLDPILSNIYLTPSIVRARAVDAAINAVKGDKGADKFLVQLREWANHLSGKSNRMGDRQLADTMWGRPLLNTIGKVQSMVGRNSIIGNVSTALVQPVVLNQAIAKHGLGNTGVALVQEMASLLGRAGSAIKGLRGAKLVSSDPINNSAFLTRRYLDVTSPQKGVIQTATDKANFLLRVVEEATARITWRSAYNEALSRDLTGADAIRYADNATESNLAGRSIGEKPEAFRSRTLSPLLQFQLEVANVGRQFLKEMTWPQRARFMLAAAVFSAMTEAVMGRSVGLNPLGALYEGLQELQNDENEGAWDKTRAFAQRIFGHVLQNTPGTSIASTIMDDDTRKAWFGDTDFGRFGNTAAISQVLNKPWYLVSPFGAAQVEKTIGGADALNKGYTESADGRVQTPIETDLGNQVRGLLFGKNSLPEQQAYYDQKRTPLGEDQSQYIKDLPADDRQGAYDRIIDSREQEAAKRKEREARKEELLQSGTTDSPAASATGDLKSRAKQLRDDSSILGKTLEEVLTERQLPDTIKTYEQAAAHISGNYEDFVEAYDLKPKNAKTGSGKFEGLVNDTAQSDIYAIARGLFRGEEKYASLPDEIKQQFYKQNGLNEAEVEYDTYSKFPTDSKANFLANEIAAVPVGERFNALAAYRRESYSGTLFASNAVINQLVDADLISEADGKALKALTVGKDGKAKRKGGVKGLKVPAYSITTPKLTRPTDFRSGLPRTTINPATGRIGVRGIKKPAPIAVKQEPLKRLAVRK